MSYYGIRKMKFVVNSEGKHNISCEFYDSSIRDYNGNRVWEKTENLYGKGFDTKAELEEIFFKDVLDGNIHGASGKYACLNWHSRKVELPLEIKKELEELENKYWELSKEVSDIQSKVCEANKDVLQPIKECKGYEEYFRAIENLSPLYKAKSTELQELSKTKRELRYNSYRNAWEKYLESEKENKKNKSNYIVILDYSNYHNVFIQTKSDYKTTFSYYISNAKIFNKSITELKEMFLSNPKYSNIRVINVEKYLTGKGKYKHISNYNEVEKLEGINLELA